MSNFIGLTINISMSQNMEVVLEILFGCIRCGIGNVKHEERAWGIEDPAG
jgi:hypothetical protein